MKGETLFDQLNRIFRWGYVKGERPYVDGLLRAREEFYEGLGDKEGIQTALDGGGAEQPDASGGDAGNEGVSGLGEDHPRGVGTDREVELEGRWSPTQNGGGGEPSSKAPGRVGLHMAPERRRNVQALGKLQSGCELLQKQTELVGEAKGKGRAVETRNPGGGGSEKREIGG